MKSKPEEQETSRMLERALAIAVEAHSAAVDRYGKPYILHVIRVGMAGKSFHEMIAGFLHDVVEDTDWTIEDLRREGFPEEILTAVNCLTKREAELYDDFVLRTASDALAKAVKLNDLKDNLNVLRVAGELQESDLARLNKYLRAKEFLER